MNCAPIVVAPLSPMPGRGSVIRVAAAPVRWSSIDGRLRGAYRLADDDLDRYELYVGQDAEPDVEAAPAATSASLPFSYALAADHEYRVIVRRRNAYGLVSQNRNVSTIRLDVAGDEEGLPPSAPDSVTLEPAAAGAVRVRAWYHPGPDGDNAADTFLVYLTTGGGDPDPDVDATHTTSVMDAGDGVARLDYTSAGLGDGVTVKVVVRTRRSGTPNVDSENVDIFTAVTDEDGPTTPTSAGAHLGRSAEVDQ